MGYTIWPDGPTGDALSDVNEERFRQEELRRSGKFYWTCADVGPSDEAKLAVLSEEVGEVARLVVESVIDPKRRDKKKLREELIQVAAVAVAWAEALSK